MSHPANAKELINENQAALLFHIDEDNQNNGEEQPINGVEIQEQSTSTTNCEEDQIENALEQSNELPKKTVISYAIGHFYNDLCASMWFTYLLIFLENVELLYSWQAGLLMLIGQITDAICTPLVGLLSDHSFLPKFLLRFGRRKSWHIIGTFCVSISFPLIFSGCLFCQKLPWLRLLWFIPPIMLFQFGWASVQISHLALIPELTKCEHSRMSMTSFRYGFTVIANLSVFAILFLFLSLDGQITTIGPEDLSSFRNLGLFCVGSGLAVTSIFYAKIAEPIGQRRISQLNLLEEEENNSQQFIKMNWYRWFSYAQFYQTAALYLFTRVYINISQIYFSFYITQTQLLGKKFVALLPLTSYLSSFAISFLLGLSPISRRINGKPLFFSGALLGLLNSILFFFVQSNWPASSFLLYILSSILGITQAILLICSLNTTASLINQNTESGAFVYGAMSFLDKLFNGLIVQLVEFFNPSSCQHPGGLISHSTICSHFYRNLMSIIPGGCVLAIILVLFTINLRTLTNSRRNIN